ncbi:hypothetical protein ACP4OV_025280 [Aristida adscensionis]
MASPPPPRAAAAAATSSSPPPPPRPPAMASLGEALPRLMSELRQIKGLSAAEGECFASLVRRHITGKAIAFSEFSPPDDGDLVFYDDLISPCGTENLKPYDRECARCLFDKVVVVKLLRGLRAATSVSDQDLSQVTNLAGIVQEISLINEQFGCHIPLFIFMPSRNEALLEAINQYKNPNIEILSLIQGKYPGLNASQMPLVISEVPNAQSWYHPGDGNLYEVLNGSRKLQTLLVQGKEYMLVSDVDSTGVKIDQIVEHGESRQIPAKYSGRLRLMDFNNVSNKHFRKVMQLEGPIPAKAFTYTNTKQYMGEFEKSEGCHGGWKPELGCYTFCGNHDDGTILLATTAAGAIKCFERSILLIVPPVRVLKDPAEVSSAQSGSSITDEDLAEVEGSDAPFSPGKSHTGSIAATSISDRQRKNISMVINLEGAIDPVGSQAEEYDIEATRPESSVTNERPAAVEASDAPYGRRASMVINLEHAIDPGKVLVPLGGFHLRGIQKVQKLRLTDLLELIRIRQLRILFAFYSVYHAALCLLDAMIISLEKNEARQTWYEGASWFIVVTFCMFALRWRRREVRIERLKLGEDAPKLTDRVLKAVEAQEDSDMYHVLVHALTRFIYTGLIRSTRSSMNIWGGLVICHIVAALIEIFGSYIVEMIFQTDLQLDPSG